MRSSVRPLLTTLCIAATLSAAVPAQAAPICLQSHQIRYTSVRDSQTIDFRMNDGTVWRNHLRDACIGLKFNGFSDVMRGNDEICANLEIIHVIRTGETCVLGDFTQIAPPSHV